ncbi:hypothetical protein TpMuguga_01g02195 [Theileria parva strain Muguga]|uniref:uncharacterized protein n=1 Tax=Theileria parva strain Muguga TaxID=333668 RepID=UPI001C621249|nr:uncharacterized protein TpMuguga_01g02195 [Theileria parva strain Muguga]KAF5153490.1 hypothetical protein TpMuguga_01g02195 [Theileria parva strain Muguga]
MCKLDNKFKMTQLNQICQIIKRNRILNSINNNTSLILKPICSQIFKLHYDFPEENEINCNNILLRTWETNMRRKTYKSKKRKRFIRIGERILRIS